MTRRTRLLVLLGALAAPAFAVPGSASAAACGRAGSAGNGLGITNVRVANTTCSVGRDVAHRYGQAFARHVTDKQGRSWTCKVTQKATGTDPGYIARTKVRCTRSRAVVRLELQS